MPYVIARVFDGQVVQGAPHPYSFGEGETSRIFQIGPEFWSSDEYDLLMGNAERVQIEDDLQVAEKIRLQPLSVIDHENEWMLPVAGRKSFEQ